MKKNVLFVLIIILACFITSCKTNITDNKITDAGKKQVGPNMYLKKIYVGVDRIYILVNEKDEIIAGSIGTAYTEKHGKTSSYESNTFIFNPEKN
jgi:hypothetical protein